MRKSGQMGYFLTFVIYFALWGVSVILGQIGH